MLASDSSPLEAETLEADTLEDRLEAPVEARDRLDFPVPRRRPSRRILGPIARKIERLSTEQWGVTSAVRMIGLDPKFLELQEKIHRIARFDEPVLVMGESGAGKELMAQALYLLSPRRGKPYVPVNCPQYREGNLTVSELFGHRKGSFTGAVADRKGCFETAAGGVIFLDEIADLHMSAQVMLLRALANKEFQPLGSDRKTAMNVRVVAATNRSLEKLRVTEEFRHDLFFRLRYFQLDIPPLRERGDDWRLLFDHFLGNLAVVHGIRRRLSAASEKLLASYGWPGNVRELSSVATTGYAMASSERIEPADFVAMLEQPPTVGASGGTPDLWLEMTVGGGSFWDVVHQPFLDRDLNRGQVRSVIRRGLTESRGSYRDLLPLFGLDDEEYQRFMDFLRHHRLKP